MSGLCKPQIYMQVNFKQSISNEVMHCDLLMNLLDLFKLFIVDFIIRLEDECFNLICRENSIIIQLQSHYLAH